MRTIVCSCLFVFLVSEVFGQPPEPPISDTRLPVSTLVREDGKLLYPVRDDIPIMLIDESIPLPQHA